MRLYADEWPLATPTSAPAAPPEIPPIWARDFLAVEDLLGDLIEFELAERTQQLQEYR